MDVAEIAVGKLVAGLGVRGLLLVDAEMPPGVFGEAVLLDEAVLLLGGGLVLAPVVALAEHGLALGDELLRLLEGALVELDRIHLDRHRAAASPWVTASLCRGAATLP